MLVWESHWRKKKFVIKENEAKVLPPPTKSRMGQCPMKLSLKPGLRSNWSATCPHSEFTPWERLPGWSPSGWVFFPSHFTNLNRYSYFSLFGDWYEGQVHNKSDDILWTADHSAHVRVYYCHCFVSFHQFLWPSVHLFNTRYWLPKVYTIMNSV